MHSCKNPWSSLGNRVVLGDSSTTGASLRRGPAYESPLVPLISQPETSATGWEYPSSLVLREQHRRRHFSVERARREPSLLTLSSAAFSRFLSLGLPPRQSISCRVVLSSSALFQLALDSRASPGLSHSRSRGGRRGSLRCPLHARRQIHRPRRRGGHEKRERKKRKNNVTKSTRRRG